MAPAIALARIAAFFLVLNRVIASALTIGCLAACAHPPSAAAIAPASGHEIAIFDATKATRHVPAQ
jgi:hypothetical protein